MDDDDILQFASSANTSDLSLRNSPIIQKKLKTYPKNRDNRCFNPSWFNLYSWLEYSPLKDAAFCYACRHHGKGAETSFTSTGFSNWKCALSKGKGFKKHVETAGHIQAMSQWKEAELRKKVGAEVSTLVNNDVLEKNRYYVKSIFDVTKFLVLNELPFRGSYIGTDDGETGLFTSLFTFTIKKDVKLANIIPLIPKHAMYNSPKIQNEIIAIMATMVGESVVEDVKNADVPFFTLLEDGTKDKNGRENIALGIRYISNGCPKESILAIKTCENLDAKAFTALTPGP